MTVSGWVWSCRTCLHTGSAASEAVARARRASHDASPVPWWRAQLDREASQ